MDPWSAVVAGGNRCDAVPGEARWHDRDEQYIAVGGAHVHAMTVADVCVVALAAVVVAPAVGFGAAAAGVAGVAGIASRPSLDAQPSSFVPIHACQYV